MGRGRGAASRWRGHGLALGTLSGIPRGRALHPGTVGGSLGCRGSLAPPPFCRSSTLNVPLEEPYF